MRNKYIKKIELVILSVILATQIVSPAFAFADDEDENNNIQTLEESYLEGSSEQNPEGEQAEEEGQTDSQVTDGEETGSESEMPETEVQPNPQVTSTQNSSLLLDILDDAIIDEETGCASFDIYATSENGEQLYYSWEWLDYHDVNEMLEGDESDEEIEAIKELFWTPIDGETESTLTISGLDKESYLESYWAYMYRCVVSTEQCSEVTNDAFLIPPESWLEDVEGEALDDWVDLPNVGVRPLNDTAPANIGSAGQVKGTDTNVVVFVNFKDSTADACVNNIANIMTYFQRDDGNLNSLSPYVNKVSNGIYNVVNLFPQFSESGYSEVKVNINCSEYTDPNDDTKILPSVQSYLTTALASRTGLDHRQSGYIDNVTIILCGTFSNFRSHASFASHDINSQQGIKIGSYTVISEAAMNNDKSGVITHEYLHGVGFPDLYCDNYNPVGRWDIMSSECDYLQYPLSWMRYAVAKWLTDANFTNVSTDGQYEIYAPTRDANGTKKQALILKTPYSDSEFFVVEYRIRETQQGSLDGLVRNTGVIVYRVNNNAQAIDNKYGYPYYIYVFRDGDTDGKGSGLDYNTYIPRTASEMTIAATSFGSSEEDALISDGAIVYSDGRNSGITICVNQVGNDSCKVNVSFAPINNTDIWAQDNIGNDSANAIASCVDASGTLYSVVSDGSNAKIYSNGQLVGTISNAGVSGVAYNKYSAVVKDGVLYLLANKDDSCSLYSFNLSRKTSSLCNTWEGYYSNSTLSYNSSGVVFGAIEDNTNLKFYLWNGASASAIGSYSDGNMLGGLKLTTDGANTYACVRNAYNTTATAFTVGSSVSKLFSVTPQCGAGAVDVAVDGGKLYLVTGQNTGSVYSYDLTAGGDPSSLGSISTGMSDVSLCVKDGTAYATVATNTEPYQLKLIKISNNSASQLGQNLTVLSDYDTVLIGNAIYLSGITSTKQAKLDTIAISSSQGQTNVLKLLSDQASSGELVYLDGVPYNVDSNLEIALPNGFSPKVLTKGTIYTPSSDIHTQYPTAVKVYFVEQASAGVLSAREITALDNCLQYKGSSIRITGVKGIRMITGVPEATRNSLISGSIEGYTLEEYGTLLAWKSNVSEDNPLVLGKSYVKSNYAYKKGVADPIFKQAGGLIQYTNVVTFGTDMSKCVNDLALRPYMILSKDGQTITIYGEIIYRNIGYVAYQNRNAFAQGTDSYNYIWSIINYVYPNGYEA